MTQLRTFGTMMKQTRRSFLQAAIASTMALRLARGSDASADDRVAGLLIGSCLGDALGGPVEFQTGPAAEAMLLNTRWWDDGRRVTAADCETWARTLELRGYATTRPEPAPYGQWQVNAPPGTMTDDTRHKVVLLDAIQDVLSSGAAALSADDVARAYLGFRPEQAASDKVDLDALCEEAFREYRMAARWRLGERDPTDARPVERLWGGVPNCSGQMLLLPLAGAFPGRPEDAYRAAYALDFVDNGAGRDIAAALVAGLAELLGASGANETPADRWQRFLKTMRETDPFGYGEVPFIGRRLDRWLDAATSIANRADGSPKRLFELLETEGQPRFWWDAHFTLLCPVAIATFCEFDPLAALHLTLDFGHDTDSYAQVLGAIIGAVHGASVFPRTMVDIISVRLRQDLNRSIDDWARDLRVLQDKLEAVRLVIVE